MRRNNSKTDTSGPTENRKRLGEEEEGVSDHYYIKRPRNLLALMDNPRTHTRTRHSSSTATPKSTVPPPVSLTSTSSSLLNTSSNSAGSVTSGDSDKGVDAGIELKEEPSSIITAGTRDSDIDRQQFEMAMRTHEDMYGSEDIGNHDHSNSSTDLPDTEMSCGDEDINMLDKPQQRQGITKKFKSNQDNETENTDGLGFPNSVSNQDRNNLNEDVDMKDYMSTAVPSQQLNSVTPLSKLVDQEVQQSQEQHKNKNIFKPFDMKTGQFLRVDSNSNEQESTTSANNRSNESHQGSITKENNISPDDLSHTERTDTTDKHNKNSALQLNEDNVNSKPTNDTPVVLTDFMNHHNSHKVRSHSVPTILHSSLRRMTTTNIPVVNKDIYPFKTNAAYHQPSTKATNFSKGGIIISKDSAGEGVYQKNMDERGLKADNMTSSSMVALRKAMILSQQFHNETSKRNITENEMLLPTTSLDERIEYLKRTRDVIPLPPINLQGLKEIDLHEIMKNPQLRHDIIFDPLLQFRPNLDGERGVKKRQLAAKYWSDVENEIIVYKERPELFEYGKTRLVPLFDTLKEVLLTIVPQKEATTINNVLDTELNMQELLKGSLVMTNLSEWLAELFKRHCAPMRDAWVDKMSATFKEAETENSLSKLIDGLRIVFQILETMKLDIANHQIRILRPALLSNAVEFEKQYFNTLMNSKRIDLVGSLKWFSQKFDSYVKNNEFNENNIQIPDVYRICIKSIISLLSCRKMVREYPTSLSFDHARLILLRADIRQIVCLQVCRLLFQQLVANDNSIDKMAKSYIINKYSNKLLVNDIVSIITDDHGNCRWTKNTLSIAVHLCKVISDLKLEYTNNAKGQGSIANTRSAASTKLDTNKINFAKSWLGKQTQPLSDVYGVLENRIFKLLEDGIYRRSSCTLEGRVKQDFVYLYNANPSQNTEGDTSAMENSGQTLNIDSKVKGIKNSSLFAYPLTDEMRRNMATYAVTEMEEFGNVFRHLYTVVNLHWSVFGMHYADCLGDKIAKKGI